MKADLARIALPSAAGGEWQELSKADSLVVVADLDEHLQFDVNTSYWAGGGDPMPEISITDSGLEKVDRIRDERPERWWWPPNWR